MEKQDIGVIQLEETGFLGKRGFLRPPFLRKLLFLIYLAIISQNLRLY